ncbi:MAG TPA: phosphate ABC transporter permease PstA [Kofleriaceae bacterium]|nr:phosphate ABC transporter permease PstA [Kofleriaceae bacterium]
MRAPGPAQRRRRRTGERLFFLLCLASVLVPLAMLATLIGDVVLDGAGRLSWEFLRGTPSRRASAAGIWPALIGSLTLIGLTALLAVPVGVAAAVYLEEYGRRSRMAGIIEVNIANLAGVPSIIYGLLGLEVFVRLFGMGSTVVAGACTLALLVLPVVIMASREALRTAPDALREGAVALGATRWQAIRQVVLPLALPGILTGAILAVARALGETAPLIVVGAVVFITFTPDLGSQYTALPIQIFNWVSMPQKAFLDNAAAAIVVLLVVLLLLSSTAIFLRNKYQARL